MRLKLAARRRRPLPPASARPRGEQRRPHRFQLGNTVETRSEIIGRREGAVGDGLACRRCIIPVDARSLHRAVSNVCAGKHHVAASDRFSAVKSEREGRSMAEGVSDLA